MLLMGIREFAQSRGISDKRLRRLIMEGKISAAKDCGKWLLVAEVVDKQLTELFAPPPMVQVPKLKNGFRAALKAAAYK